jgi:carbamoyl-phosphate synthase large subunit
MDKINVLITAASRRVALIKNFSVLKEKLPFMGETIAVDYNLLSPALYFADKYYKVPPINDKNYYNNVMEIVKKRGVKLIIPTIDIELPLWGNKREILLEEGIFVAASPEKTAIICNDKFKSYEFFKKNYFPTPETWTKKDILKINENNFPLFIKPAKGRGSVNTYKINNGKELDFFIKYVKEPIIQQYIDGEEFTVDLISDFNGNVLSIVPRKRLLVRAGVSDRGVTFYNKKIIEDIKLMAEKLKIIGPSNFQGFISENGIHYIEVNPRFSGGIQLTIAAGVNFPELLVRLVHGENIKPFIGDYKKEIYMTSYSESIFLYGGKPIK